MLVRNIEPYSTEDRGGRLACGRRPRRAGPAWSRTGGVRRRCTRAVGHGRGRFRDCAAGSVQAPEAVNDAVAQPAPHLRRSGLQRRETPRRWTRADRNRGAKTCREVRATGSRQGQPVQARTGQGPLVRQHHAFSKPPQTDPGDESLARVLPALRRRRPGGSGRTQAERVRGGDSPRRSSGGARARRSRYFCFRIALREVHADDVVGTLSGEGRALRLRHTS